MPALARLIVPPTCALCGGDGQVRDEPGGLDLCQHCERECQPARHACPRCGQPGAAAGSCPACAAHPPLFDAAFCAFIYADPVDQMIQQLKFRHELVFARVLGTLLARARRAAHRPLPDCIVPLPLHPARYRERGFCQTTLIARHVGRRLSAPAVGQLPLRTDLLLRSRDTRAQSALPAPERAGNLRAAFRLAGSARPPRRIALLDDVLTTGATANAATAVLKAAGAEYVEIWCCARAALGTDAPAALPRAARPIW